MCVCLCVWYLCVFWMRFTWLYWMLGLQFSFHNEWFAVSLGYNYSTTSAYFIFELLLKLNNPTFNFADYVYVETTPNSPFLIRRIEELNKNQTGNVEAKVMCFYRRRDLPNPLVQLADKHQRKYANSGTYIQTYKCICSCVCIYKLLVSEVRLCCDEASSRSSNKSKSPYRS